jgi:hypothetical protein
MSFFDDELYVERLLAEPRAGCIELLSRPGGATVVEFQERFHWQAHTVRGFLSRLSHDGVEVRSERVAGVRRYSTAYSLEEMVEL